MVQIRGSIKMLNERVINNPKHRLAIEQEKKIYKEILQPYLKEANDNEAVVQRPTAA